MAIKGWNIEWENFILKRTRAFVYTTKALVL